MLHIHLVTDLQAELQEQSSDSACHAHMGTCYRTDISAQTALLCKTVSGQVEDFSKLLTSRGSSVTGSVATPMTVAMLGCLSCMR